MMEEHARTISGPQPVQCLTKTDQDKHFRIPDMYIVKQPGKKLPAKPFPLKLMEILSYRHHDNINYQDIITWLPDGKSFKVLKPKEFTNQIMPRHMKKAKYSSFQRKMLCWGFQKVVVTFNGDDEEQVESSSNSYRGHGLPTTFVHPYFQRNRTDLLEQLHFSKTATTFSSTNKNKTPSPPSNSCTKRKTTPPPSSTSSYVGTCNTAHAPAHPHKKQKLVPPSSFATIIEESPPSSPPLGGLSREKVRGPNNQDSFQLSPTANLCSSPPYCYFENKTNLPPRKRPVNISSLFSVTSAQHIDPKIQASPLVGATPATTASAAVPGAPVSPAMSKSEKTLSSSLSLPSVLPPPLYDMLSQQEAQTSPLKKHCDDTLPDSANSDSDHRRRLSPLLLVPKSDNGILVTAKKPTTKRTATTTSPLLSYLQQQNYNLQREIEMISSERDHYKRLLVEQWLSHG